MIFFGFELDYLNDSHISLSLYLYVPFSLFIFFSLTPLSFCLSTPFTLSPSHSLSRFLCLFLSIPFPFSPRHSCYHSFSLSHLSFCLSIPFSHFPTHSLSPCFSLPVPLSLSLSLYLPSCFAYFPRYVAEQANGQEQAALNSMNADIDYFITEVATQTIHSFFIQLNSHLASLDLLNKEKTKPSTNQKANEPFVTLRPFSVFMHENLT